jgi:solute carrier family 25 S-adenosylmethionine transporter 26
MSNCTTITRRVFGNKKDSSVDCTREWAASLLLRYPHVRGFHLRGSCAILIHTLAGAFFTTYEGLKSRISKLNPNYKGSPLIPQPLIHASASMVAELVSCFILTPAEVLKQNAQMILPSANSSKSKSLAPFRSSVTLHVLKQFRRPSQLFRGYTALAARNLPFTAMQFPMFEHMKDTLIRYRKDNGAATGSLLETGLVTAFSAGVAGSISATITAPVDVVKTRMMLSTMEQASQPIVKSEIGVARKQQHLSNQSASKKKIANRSGLAIAHEIMSESGIKGLFRGGTLRAAWTALGSGLYLSVYECGCVWLGNRHDEGANHVL